MRALRGGRWSRDRGGIGSESSPHDPSVLSCSQANICSLKGKEIQIL